MRTWWFLGPERFLQPAGTSKGTDALVPPMLAILVCVCVVFFLPSFPPPKQHGGISKAARHRDDDYRQRATERVRGRTTGDAALWPPPRLHSAYFGIRPLLRPLVLF